MSYYYSDEKDARRKKYFEGFNTPEWFAKRDEILKLENYQCEICGKKNVPLECHHRFYPKADFMCYEHPLNGFSCLCKKCHQKETFLYNTYFHRFNIDLKILFTYEETLNIWEGFKKMVLFDSPMNISRMIGYLLSDEMLMRRLWKYYFTKVLHETLPAPNLTHMQRLQKKIELEGVRDNLVKFAKFGG